MKKADVLKRIKEIGLLPVLRAASVEEAAQRYAAFLGKPLEILTTPA